MACLEQGDIEKRKEVVDKILQLFEDEGLSKNQANAIPDLLEQRLQGNRQKFEREQKFTIY